MVVGVEGLDDLQRQVVEQVAEEEGLIQCLKLPPQH